VAAYFFDSSALVKRFARETGTGWMLSLFRRAAGNRLYVARIAGVETVAALARKRRNSSLTVTEATRARSRLHRDMRLRLRIVEVTPGTLLAAETLADRHYLRGYDAVQLAAALEANAERTTAGLAPLALITADKDLLAAASVEGLSTDDPNNH